MKPNPAQLQKLKIIIIGNSFAGKTTLLNQYLYKRVIEPRPTICMDFISKVVQFQGRPFKIELWDTAGQQKYKSIIFKYFNNSKGACILFDIADDKSFDDCVMWMQELTDRCGVGIPIVLIANKCDILGELELQERLMELSPKIQKIKQSFGCQFMTISAMKGTNVTKVFEYLIEQLFNKYLKIQKQTNVNLKDSFMLSVIGSEPYQKMQGRVWLRGCMASRCK